EVSQAAPAHLIDSKAPVEVDRGQVVAVDDEVHARRPLAEELADEEGDERGRVAAAPLFGKGEGPAEARVARGLAAALHGRDDAPRVLEHRDLPRRDERGPVGRGAAAAL